VLDTVYEIIIIICTAFTYYYIHMLLDVYIIVLYMLYYRIVCV